MPTHKAGADISPEKSWGDSKRKEGKRMFRIFIFYEVLFLWFAKHKENRMRKVQCLYSYPAVFDQAGCRVEKYSTG